MTGDDWPPRDSAWRYPEGKRKYGSTGQLWEVRDKQWMRITETTPHPCIEPKPVRGETDGRV